MISRAMLADPHYPFDPAERHAARSNFRPTQADWNDADGGFIISAEDGML